VNEFPASRLLREFAHALLDFANGARNSIERAGFPQDEANQLALLQPPLDVLREQLMRLRGVQGQATAPAWEVLDDLIRALEAFLERLPNT
jgi:hypothetical protein